MPGNSCGRHVQLESRQRQWLARTARYRVGMLGGGRWEVTGPDRTSSSVARRHAALSLGPCLVPKSEKFSVL